MGKKRNSRGHDIPAKEGMGRSRKGPNVNNTFEERVSGEDAEFSSARNGLKREGKELRNLGADMLGEVFSYLPQKQLFEVLSVSKDWGKAVMEGTGLWSKVDVFRNWNLGSERRGRRGNEILRRVIGFAEDVTFSEAFKRNKWSPVHICHPNLKSLKFYGYLPLVLTVNCPALTHLSTLGVLNFIGSGLRDSDTPRAPSLF